jgi:hypothetical protein
MYPESSSSFSASASGASRSSQRRRRRRRRRRSSGRGRRRSNGRIADHDISPRFTLKPSASGASDSARRSCFSWSASYTGSPGHVHAQGRAGAHIAPGSAGGVDDRIGINADRSTKQSNGRNSIRKQVSYNGHVHPNRSTRVESIRQDDVAVKRRSLHY